jgi:uncharacterized membrane protein YsdA (DUF1294 family)
MRPAETERQAFGISAMRSAAALECARSAMNQTAIVIYLSLVVVMSCVTFVAYGLDKRRATNGGRRIAERTLHLLALLGGWPGAWLAQRQFRHKTQKASFVIMFWLVVGLHVAAVAAAGYGVLAWSPQ